MVGTTLRLVPLLAVLLWGAGCSYAFVRGPSAPSVTSPVDPHGLGATAPECTASNAAPIVDTVLAVPLIGAGVLGIVGGASSGSCTSYCFAPSGGEIAAVGVGLLALGALAMSSAVTGYGRTADCRRALESLPTGRRSTERYLLDVPAIAQARTRPGS